MRRSAPGTGSPRSRCEHVNFAEASFNGVLSEGYIMQFVCKSHSANTRWSQSISDSTRMSHQSKTTISSPRTMKTGTSRELKRRRWCWYWWRKEGRHDHCIQSASEPENPAAGSLQGDTPEPLSTSPQISEQKVFASGQHRI